MKFFLYLTLAASLLFYSCKDDNCVPGALETVVIGHWEVHWDELTHGDVEFTEDDVFIDHDESLVSNPNHLEMLYFVDSETQMRIRVMLITPVDYIVAVQDFGCDEIKLSVTGLDYTLKRK